MSKRVDHPIILGIVGDSASGKTTLSAGVAQILGEERCTVICTDDYHAFDRAERTRLGLSALDPKANYLDILEQHLRLLREGQPILKPQYDHKRGTLERPVYVKPRDFIIAEGLLGYTTRAMRDCYDVKIYLDPIEDLRVKWKLQRDTTQRGYRVEEVVQWLARRNSDGPSYIHPQRTFADIVIRFQWPESSDGSDTRLDVRHLLRPTLPHPDFTPLFNGVHFDGANDIGLTFGFARDDDGKPVDVLEIRGDISDSRAEKIEDLLWDLIPEAGHMRDRVGRIDVINGVNGNAVLQPRTSHPLALTQLLVGYHAVKAAMGVRAY